MKQKTPIMIAGLQCYSEKSFFQVKSLKCLLLMEKDPFWGFFGLTTFTYGH